MVIFEENRASSLRSLALLMVGLVAVGALSCSQRAAEPPPNSESADAANAQQKVVEAEQHYAQRGNLDQVRLAVSLLRQARVSDAGNFEAAWKLARAAYYLGAHTTDDREREDAFREGIEAGKIAVLLQDNKPDGHFWLGANYGGDAENSTLAGLANVQDIRNQMETVIKLDESYQSGSAYLGLGQLYLQAPRVLGGDTQKAIEYLEKGLRFGSQNALLRLNLAEAYHQAKRDGDARKQIEFILQMTPDPNYQAEQNEAIEGAKKLSEEMERGN